jgi:hypothetical protein
MKIAGPAAIREKLSGSVILLRIWKDTYWGRNTRHTKAAGMLAGTFPTFGIEA